MSRPAYCAGQSRTIGTLSFGLAGTTRSSVASDYYRASDRVAVVFVALLIPGVRGLALTRRVPTIDV